MYHPSMESEEDILHHNLMVNYLPSDMTSEQLRELFKSFGTVKECIVICDPQTGESRGYGFVRFTRRADAENAMAEMNGFTVEGKRLVVKKADVGKDVDGAASVYVAGFQIRSGIARELRRLFSDYGIVLDVTLLNPLEGRDGVAFVKFARYADAIAAVENVKEYRRQPLTVKIASQTAKRATRWQRKAKDYDDTITLAQHTCNPQSDRNVLVLYHYPTADGILAALAAHLYLTAYHPELTARDVAVIPHPVYRPSPAPDRLPINRRMTDVFLLGYAGSPDYVQQLAHECNSVTILDHHQAARDCFTTLQEARALPPSVEVVADGDRSAATLAWDYFTEKAGGSLLGPGGNDAPLRKLRRLFDYSEDHALGRHYLPGSRACAYALQKANLVYNVLENKGIWKVLMDLDVTDLISKGESMLAEQDAALSAIVDKSFIIQIRDPHDPEHSHFGQCLAVLTDHPEGIGEMAYRLAVKSAESGLRAIGAVAFQKLGDANCKLTLRAVNNTDEDTLVVAQTFEGAGHPRNNPGASSFFVPFDVFQSWVVAQAPAPPMPRNLSHTANQLALQYQVSRPEAYDGVLLEVTPAYFEVALGTIQTFEGLGAPPLLVQNVKQMGFNQCPQVAAAVFPIQTHRDVLCLLPRAHAAEHVYLWMVFMGLLKHLDPAITRLHSLIMCSTIPLAQHVYVVAQAYAKGTGARISCVCEPVAKTGDDILECHVLITTPNAATMLCREGQLNLAFLKMVMIHDTDRVLHLFLRNHLVEVLNRVWSARKRSGVTVGMYTTGSYRAVRQLAADLMEKDADQHVTVTVMDPREPEHTAPTTGLTAVVDPATGLNMRSFLEQLQPSPPALALKGGPFTGQVSSIFNLPRAPIPAGPSAPLGPVPTGFGPAAPLGFAGNVQALLGQLQPQARLPMMPAPAMVPGLGGPPPMPALPAFPGLAAFPSLPMGVPPPRGLSPSPYDAFLGAPGLPGAMPMFGSPMALAMGGFGSKGEPLRGPPMGFTGGKGRGKGAGKGATGLAAPVVGGGKGVAVPKAGLSDGMPRAEGPSGPVYPWQR